MGVSPHGKAGYDLSVARSLIEYPLLTLKFFEPYDGDGRVKTLCEIRLDVGQANGPRLVEQKGPRYW